MVRRALCIGINDYPGTGSDLFGCINDANDWSNILQERGFEVQQLLDAEATKSAMLASIQRIVHEAVGGDSIVITYSGHGSWIPDKNGDEPDKRDEVLCPYDIAQNRPLTDDQLSEIFAVAAPGLHLAFISDSCHSGTVSKLGPAPANSIGPLIRGLAPAQFLPPDDAKLATRLARVLPSDRETQSRALLLSGCDDTEFSYDAEFGGRPNGAFTYIALQTLRLLPTAATYRDWHSAIREKLPNPRHPQSPQLDGADVQMLWKVFE